MFIDPDLLQYDEMWAAAGTWNDVFGIAPQALVDASEGLVTDLNAADCRRGPVGLGELDHVAVGVSMPSVMFPTVEVEADGSPLSQRVRHEAVGSSRCSSILAIAGRGRFNGSMAGTGDAVELTAVLWAAPEGGFSALNPETGTTSEGETQEEAVSNLAEATALYLEEFPLPRGERPVVTTFHIADVA